jgi:hypothetical protein
MKDEMLNVGLLLQRALTSTFLLYFGALHALETARLVPSVLCLIAVVAGFFGWCWTPFYFPMQNVKPPAIKYKTIL